MILSKSSDDSYIGRTINLDHVKFYHKSNYKRDSNRKLYKFISEHGGIDNFKFIKLEECPEGQATERKQFYVDKFMPSLNNRK